MIENTIAAVVLEPSKVKNSSENRR